MARGAPDYSNVRAESPIHRLDDMAELAARQGSPFVFDRSGDVIMLQDFRYGLSLFSTDSGGLGETIEISNLYSLYGGYTAHLGRVANSSSYADIYTRYPQYGLSRLGAQVLFTPVTNTSRVALQIVRFTGSERLTYALLWDGNAAKTYYLNASNSWVEIADDVGMYVSYPTYSVMKLVVDPSAEEYVRAAVNGTEISMAGLTGPTTTSTLASHVRVGVLNDSGLTWASDVYVDAIIITTNEQ